MQGKMIQPHSGKLVERVVGEKERRKTAEKAKQLSQIILDEEKAKEVQNIAPILS